MHAVSLKLPEFLTDIPEVCFFRVKIQFRSRTTTLDSTRFDSEVTTLNNRTADKVEFIICQPPQQDKNVALTAPISAFEKS